MPESQGKVAEEWVKNFAREYHILSNKQFSLEKLVKLLDTKLQRRFIAARSYVEKELPYSGNWIDLILSNKRLPQQVSEQAKAALVEKVLDYALATDVLIAVKTNQGRDCLIAVDVTTNLAREQKKLSTIQGRRENGDPTGFNRNQNLPEVIKHLGIHKHGILVINYSQLPSYEHLLNEIYAFANSPARTRSINLFSPVSDLSHIQQQAISTLTAQELWHKYNQEVTGNSPLQRQIAIAEKALQDGHAVKLPDILACDPFIKEVQREQGTQKARYQISLVIKAVMRKVEAPQENQQLPEREQRQDKGPKL